jgi:hypothetical protein
MMRLENFYNITSFTNHFHFYKMTDIFIPFSPTW